MTSREEPRVWDVRTIDRRIRRGMTTRKDYDKHLKALPDVTDKSQAIVADGSDDEDDYLD